MQPAADTGPHPHEGVGILPLRWSSAPASGSASLAARQIPAFSASRIARISDGLDYWDAWPLLTREGRMYLDQQGCEYWFALAAPWDADIDARHAVARIHLLRFDGHVFEPLGPAMPDGLSPGSREWSGSAAIDAQTGVVRLLFTAAGRRGEPQTSFEQRLFGASARLAGGRLFAWSDPWELVDVTGSAYQRVDQKHGAPGAIKGLRDPELFHESGSGTDYILFTASSAVHQGTHDGVIGLARLSGSTATLLPPLVDATGFNNELERPHIRKFGGMLYLFWSTQSTVFADPDAQAPTGLYGACAPALTGPWQLLNGDGLVLANPPQEPQQNYSWLVLPDGRVTSFADLVGVGGRTVDAALRRACFGGTFAPFLQLDMDGSTVRLRPPA